MSPMTHHHKIPSIFVVTHSACNPRWLLYACNSTLKHGKHKASSVTSSHWLILPCQRGSMPTPGLPKALRQLSVLCHQKLRLWKRWRRIYICLCLHSTSLISMDGIRLLLRARHFHQIMWVPKVFILFHSIASPYHTNLGIAYCATRSNKYSTESLIWRIRILANTYHSPLPIVQCAPRFDTFDSHRHRIIDSQFVFYSLKSTV